MTRFAGRLWLLLLGLKVDATPVPMVMHWPSWNQAFGVAVDEGTSQGGSVAFLGYFDSLAGCEAACLTHDGDGDERCNYFVWFHRNTSGSDFAQQCHAVMSPGWNPTFDPTATTGAVQWPCRGDTDCSLNGECSISAGTCACRPAWTGSHCERLNLVKTNRAAGYRGVDNSSNTSSWGGAVLQGQDGRYHMWASEMTEHCGIGTWAQNSRIVHAESDSPGGEYVRTSVTWEVFSHEPEVVPAPDGLLAMYFTAQLRSEHGDCNCCQEGDPCDGSTGPGDCSSQAQHVGSGDSDPTYMSWTADPYGNWSDPVAIFPDYAGSDTNFAPLILANGSFLALWRKWTGSGSRIFLATGSDWRDPNTYEQYDHELFPDLGAAGTEDPFLYQDADGNYHALFHHMYGTGTADQWWLDATGGHAFSTDGFSWTYTGVSWGNATARYDVPAQQGIDVPYDDGSSFRFTRLERPHAIFSNDDPRQLRGDPSHLVVSAQYGTGTNPGTGAHNDDACYTMIWPVQQA